MSAFLFGYGMRTFGFGFIYFDSLYPEDLWAVVELIYLFYTTSNECGQISAVPLLCLFFIVAFEK